MCIHSHIYVVVAFQSLSCVWHCSPMNCSMPGFPDLHYLPEFAQIHVQWFSDAILPCCSLLLTSIFPSIRGFTSESVLCIRWPKYRPSDEYSVLISFRIDWFVLPAVQGILKSFLQHYNSKASILRHSAFFMSQLSHLYMTTGKTITLTIRTFVGKVMSPLFSTLSRFVIVFFQGASIF